MAGWPPSPLYLGRGALRHGRLVKPELSLCIDFFLLPLDLPRQLKGVELEAQRVHSWAEHNLECLLETRHTSARRPDATR